MSTPAPGPGPTSRWFARVSLHLPTVPEAFAALLRTLVVALFLLTFVLQPYLIPSESMERTLLVGDFLLVNKQVFAPPGGLARHLLPYREVARGDIVVFHHPQHPYLVKRVVGMPGDRLHIKDGRVIVNGLVLDEPYTVFEPVAGYNCNDDFPSRICIDPQVNSVWWSQMQSLVRDGDLVVPQDEYFVLGDNRNHSKDSRYWGFVSRQQIVARPLIIYFSLYRPSTTDVEQVTLQATDDRLGHDKQFSARLTGFVRWKRIFLVVH